MLSDAGGALARRRRDIFASFRNSLRSLICLVLLVCNPGLFPPFSHGVSLQGDTTDRGFPANLLSLIWNILWPARSVKEEPYLSIRSPIIKSENRLPYISRSKDLRTFAFLVALCLSEIPLKSKPPPRPSTKRSSALTSDSEMTLTAEGLEQLTLSSFSSVASSLHFCGGAPDSYKPEAKLGFYLLGFLHSCGPVPLLWPFAKNLSPSANFNRPRFNYSNSSPSPFTWLFCLHALRSRYSNPEAIRIWRCQYLPQTMVLTCPLAKAYEKRTISEEETIQEASSAEEDWKKAQVDSKKILAQPHQSATANPSRQGADPESISPETIQEANSAEEDWKKSQVDSKKILAQPHQSTTANPSPKPICIFEALQSLQNHLQSRVIIESYAKSVRGHNLKETTDQPDRNHWRHT